MQYEPKTDSKEFELLNAGQDLVPPARAVPDSADITIRLWQRSASGSLTWRTESVLVYMIADLVAASRGRVDDSTPAMTAHFDTSAQALVAAKRIQTSILEFLACRPGDSLAAAILIHQPSTIPGGFTAGMAQGALRLAEPGQILLSEETARRLRDLPGIELRDVPAMTTGGDEHAGLSELVWTSPERIARMRLPSDDGRHRDETPPMGATMIVNAPFAGPSPEPSRTARSVVGPTGLVAQDKTASTRSQKVGSDGAPASREFVPAPDSSFQAGAQELEQPSMFTRTRLILGLVAVVLVSALVWEFMPHNVAKPKLHVQENQLGTGEKPVIQNPETQVPITPKVDASKPKGPDVVVNPPPPVKSTKDKRAKDKDKDKGKQNEQNVEKPVEAVIIPGYEGLTQKDIPNLLQMARNHAGNGNYERARTEYRAILQLQPNNADAKEGLRKLDVAQSNR